MLNKKNIIITTILIIFICSFVNLFAETFPDFSREYWMEESGNARGKLFRGVGLGLLGLGSIVPTVIFINNAVDYPERFLAFSFVSGIASLGMMGHGFFSVAAGIRERRKAEYFAGAYIDNSDNVNIDEERKYYLYLKRKTALKMMFFGSVITLQSTILFANGIILNIRENRDENIGDIKIWPNYVVGGFLLAGGAFMIINKIRQLRNLRQLSTIDSDKPVVSFQPVFEVDKSAGAVSFGFTGQIQY